MSQPTVAQESPVECINDHFSTTRRLIRIAARSIGEFSGQPTSPRINFGGLRTRGLLKTSATNPLITVITVVFNGEAALEETILSVLRQTYDNIEYIVVDGGSTDGTIDILKKYEDALDFWISEPDAGIYDAMNKGIALAKGDWLNFLNARDHFFADTTVETLVDRHILPRRPNEKFFYSDVVLALGIMAGRKRLVRHTCDHRRRIINHQAAIYAKELHLKYGPYLVSKGLTISDYLFFSLIDPNTFAKVDEPIAVYDVTGISQSRRSVEQKFIVDYLINGFSRPQFIAHFFLYFYYRRTKAIGVNIKSQLTSFAASIRAKWAPRP
jgi:glycosyltransferase involved in cell wall biosynthesis